MKIQWQPIMGFPFLQLYLWKDKCNRSKNCTLLFPHSNSVFTILLCGKNILTKKKHIFLKLSPFFVSKTQTAVPRKYCKLNWTKGNLGLPRGKAKKGKRQVKQHPPFSFVSEGICRICYQEDQASQPASQATQWSILTKSNLENSQMIILFPSRFNP